MSENIFTKLMAIQAELNVPKKRFNSFSQFYFRNAEDILSAAKPVCKKHGCALFITDKPTVIGQRYYIESTATLADSDGGVIEVTASAREEETKKGFDGAQITGSASSYARKYALNGLFGLDDGDDPDGHDNRSKEVICPRCGKPVKGYTGSTGVHYTDSMVLDKYKMCTDCYRSERKTELTNDKRKV